MAQGIKAGSWVPFSDLPLTQSMTVGNSINLGDFPTGENVAITLPQLTGVLQNQIVYAGLCNPQMKSTTETKRIFISYIQSKHEAQYESH